MSASVLAFMTHNLNWVSESGASEGNSQKKVCEFGHSVLYSATLECVVSEWGRDTKVAARARVERT